MKLTKELRQRIAKQAQDARERGDMVDEVEEFGMFELSVEERDELAMMQWCALFGRLLRSKRPVSSQQDMFSRELQEYYSVVRYDKRVSVPIRDLRNHEWMMYVELLRAAGDGYHSHADQLEAFFEEQS